MDAPFVWSVRPSPLPLILSATPSSWLLVLRDPINNRFATLLPAASAASRRAAHTPSWKMVAVCVLVGAPMRLPVTLASMT